MKIKFEAELMPHIEIEGDYYPDNEFVYELFFMDPETGERIKVPAFLYEQLHDQVIDEMEKQHEIDLQDSYIHDIEMREAI